MTLFKTDINKSRKSRPKLWSCCLWGRGMLRPARMATHTGWLPLLGCLTRLIRPQHAAALLLLLALSACTATTPADEPDEPVIEHNAYITLSADIATPSLSSRADEYTFEGPAQDNEKIQTMRFIIVRPDGTVEYNIYLDGTTGTLNDDGTIISTTPRIVKPNEIKTVYLIGNEASLSQAIRDKIRLLTRGDAFDKSLITETITMDGSGPLFGANDPIPMTEIHQIEIKGAPTTDDGKGSITNPYTYNLFVTRAAVKFTFNLKVTNYEKYNKAEYKVTDITFNRIGNSEYFFPTGTTYDPVKPAIALPDIDYAQNREILSYSVPTATNVPYTFNWGEGTLEKDGSMTYSAGPVYLPETLLKTDEGSAYSITLPFCGETLSAELRDLPPTHGLARNTHVEVDIIINPLTLSIDVRIMPYMGVMLDPWFGFNDPLPRPITPHVVPPWLDIDPDKDDTDPL